MKLNAPPPPPPPPPEPGEPGPGAPPPATDPMVAPAAPAAVVTTAARPATWPAWFARADVALAAIAVALAFLLASFAARNSDLWLHLAAGKRLLTGEYIPGSDPFSYSAADRPWVNHSLLFDAGAYLLYRGNGGLLVAVKAVAVALAFGLLIGIRRPGFPLWPWAAAAAVGAVAAAPRMSLGPHAGSILLLAVTLFLLFRVPHRAGSWRFPVAVGVVFWVWANVDAWFILGPLALALVLVGELVQRGAGTADRGATNPAGTAAASTPSSAPDAPRSEDEPLGRVPDVPTLVRALAIGVLACMLNPHHYRVWDLPFELVGSKAAAADPRFQQYLFTPFATDYWADTPRGRSLGHNLNGLAYAALFVGGGLLLGLGAGRVRVAHVTLWVGFAALGLLTAAAVPFFAVVAVPLVASQLNALSARAALKTWGDPRTRFLLLGSAGGRVACLLAGAAAVVAAWPGWMHPGAGGSPFARRVAWAVEPDPAAVRAAGQFQAWRAAGKLPADARGVIASIDLANYCAWFAPAEKVYVNGRVNHHRPELPNYLAVRAGLLLFPQDEPPAPQRLRDALEAIGAEYAAVHVLPNDGQQTRGLAWGAAIRGWLDPDRWSPWYLDGRTTALGCRPTPGGGRPTFDALRVDPVALAFGPGVERLPAGSVRPVPPPGGWETEFFRATPPSPSAADEALAWAQFREVLEARQRGIDGLAQVWFGQRTPDPAGTTFHHLVAAAANPGLRPGAADDAAAASALLALRAARRAIAAEPDHPDGYHALFVALQGPGLALPDDDRVVAQVTALRQCLVRLPPPERGRRDAYRSSPADVAATLANLYLGRRTAVPPGTGLSPFAGVPVQTQAFQILAGAAGGVFELDFRHRPGPNQPASPPVQLPVRVTAQGQLEQAADQIAAALKKELARGGVGGEYELLGTRPRGPHLLALDLAHEAAKLAERYDQAAAEPGDAGKARAEEIKALVKAIEEELGRANNGYERERARPSAQRLAAQVDIALRFNLVGEALRLLNDPAADLEKEYGPQRPGIILFRAALELATGRLEDAAAHLEAASEDPAVKAARAAPAAPPGQDFNQLFLHIAYQQFLLEGDYGKAGEVIERSVIERSPVGLDRDRDPTPEQARLNPKAFLDAAVPVQWAVALAAASPPPLFGEQVKALVNYGYQPFVQRQQELRTRRLQAAGFYYRRGLLFLLEGDIAEARKRFERAPQKGVPEWGVADLPSEGAVRFLRLIDQAAK